MCAARSASQLNFKPIPENGTSPKKALQSRTQTDQDNVQTSKDSPVPEGSSTPDGTIQELRKLLTDFQEDRGGGGRGGVAGGGGSATGGGGGGGGLGSRPPSRSGLRSLSRQGSRVGSRRGSWVQQNEEEEKEEVQVSSSQKAHLLVVSQQRLVYTLQGLRHELSSLDDEVNRIRNDILNSRRFYNAMRGIQEQPTWGSSGNASSNRRNLGSGSSSPSLYSLDNSYSDDTDSLARSESCCSFASWRSEAELFNVFREAEDMAGSDKSSASNKSGGMANTSSETNHSNDINNSSGSSGGGGGGGGSSGVNGNAASKDSNSHTPPVIRGRYRQLGTPRR